eukprot:1214411-Prymnesium_polylepis.1
MITAPPLHDSRSHHHRLCPLLIPPPPSASWAAPRTPPAAVPPLRRNSSQVGTDARSRRELAAAAIKLQALQRGRVHRAARAAEASAAVR